MASGSNEEIIENEIRLCDINLFCKICYVWNL